MLVLVCGRHLGGEVELWGYKPERLENEVVIMDGSHWWRAEALWEGERVLVLAYEHKGARCATDEMRESLGDLGFPAGKPVPRHRSCGYCGKPGWPNVWCPWRMCLATFCSASCRYYHCRDIHARNPRSEVASLLVEPPSSTREDPEAVRKGAHTSYKMRGRKLRQEEMFPQRLSDKFSIKKLRHTKNFGRDSPHRNFRAYFRKSVFDILQKQT